MKNFKTVAAYIPLALIISVVVYFLWDDFIEWRKGPISPRNQNGVRLIYTDDSVYKIRFVIEDAWEIEKDPPEDTRY